MDTLWPLEPYPLCAPQSVYSKLVGSAVKDRLIVTLDTALLQECMVVFVLMLVVGFLHKKDFEISEEVFYEQVCSERVVTNFAHWPLGAKLEFDVAEALIEIQKSKVRRILFGKMLARTHPAHGDLFTDSQQSLSEMFARFVQFVEDHQIVPIYRCIDYCQGMNWQRLVGRTPGIAASVSTNEPKITLGKRKQVTFEMVTPKKKTLDISDTPGSKNSNRRQQKEQDKEKERLKQGLERYFESTG
jgi:hypothetical protein